MRQRTRASIAAALVLASWPSVGPARAAEGPHAPGGDHPPALGVFPEGGKDVVATTDDTVVLAAAESRPDGSLALSFPSGTVVLPRASVARVRRWADFDPAPRDDAEKRQVEIGMVRHEGKWIHPTEAELRRKEEQERARGRHDAGPAADAPPWSARREKSTPRFRFESSLPDPHFDEILAAVESFHDALAAALKAPRGPWKSPVLVQVGARFDEPEGPYGRLFGRTGGSGGVAVVLQPHFLEGNLPGLFRDLGEALVDRWFPERGLADEWWRHGLAEYAGAARRSGGKIVLGHPPERLLPALQRAIREGAALADADAFDDSFGPAGPDGHRIASGSRWALVHYLLDGEGGKLRPAFLAFLAGKTRERAGGGRDPGALERERRALAKALKAKSLDDLAKAAGAHALALLPSSPRALLARARARLIGKDDAAAAAALRALAATPGLSPKEAYEGAYLLCRVPAARAEGEAWMLRARDAAPLATEVRLAAARSLPPAEALREARLAREIGGASRSRSLLADDAATLGDVPTRAPGRAAGDAELAAVAAARALEEALLAESPADVHLLGAAAWLRLLAGDLDGAREVAAKAGAGSAAGDVAGQALVASLLVSGDAAGAGKAAATRARASLEGLQGGGEHRKHLEESRAGELLERAFEAAVSWGKPAAALAAARSLRAEGLKVPPWRWQALMRAAEATGDAAHVAEARRLFLADYPNHHLPDPEENF